MLVANARPLYAMLFISHTLKSRFIIIVKRAIKTGVLASFMKNIFAGSLMAIILFAGFKGIILMHVHYDTLRLALTLLLAVTIGIGIYIIVSYMLKVRELSEAVNFFKKRLIKG